MIKTLLKMLPIALLLAFFSFTAAGQTPVARATLSIGYVNGQRVFAEAADAKSEVARVEALQQQRTNELRAKQLALDSTRQQLAAAGDDQKRAQLQLQERQQRADLERAGAQAQSEVQAAQRKVRADVQNQVTKIVEELAKAQNLQLVLNGEPTVVLWAAPSLDLTSAVIERLNAKPGTITPKR